MSKIYKMVCINDVTESWNKKSFITKGKCYDCTILDLTHFHASGMYYEFMGDTGFLTCDLISDFITLEEHKKQLVKERYGQT